MPIYEYRCENCGFQKEFLQRMSDAPLTDCPECQKPSLSKMVTAAGFQLKGGGWYVTDFKGGAKGGGKGASGESSKSDKNQSDSSGSESAKAESKSEKSKSESSASTSTSSPSTSSGAS